MTLEELARIRIQIPLKSHEVLTGLAIQLSDALMDEITRRLERENQGTSLAKEYQRICAERDALRAENNQLKAILRKTAEDSQKKTQEIFGRSTEKVKDLVNFVIEEEDVDEAAEEHAEAASSSRVVPLHPAESSRHRPGKKQKGKREEELSRLPHRERFILNVQELDRQYGEKNWRIAYWHSTKTVEYTQPEVYVLESFTPVVSVGLEHALYTVPVQKLIPGSLASPSLASEILFQKFFMLLPVYRLESYFAGIGYALSRQTMNNWIGRLAFDCFGPVYDFMKTQLLEVPYHQVDETTLQVIHDGRRAGAKSYIWIHSTSELLSCHPIVLYCYELTRGTEHLRSFYEGFQGLITCDAYCAYQTLERENCGTISVSGCLMHARRRYADSLSLINKAGLTDEQIAELPETKALLLIGKIYAADEPLKQLCNSERAEKRAEVVRPLVEEYYSYIESIDLEDPLIRGRLKDAVQYSLNQKKYLCQFLGDGNVPIDNGSSERYAKRLAIARKGFMFCSSIDGAQALSIMFSMAETARANGADVRTWFRYVLETIPEYLNGTDRSFLPGMMPWSEEYRKYERQARSGLPLQQGPDEFKTRPRTPAKLKKPA